MNQETVQMRTAELRTIQQTEVANNFANGNLWNECEDKIYFLTKYGQENKPDDVFDGDGYRIGYILNNGTIIEEGGMTFENSY